MTDPSNVELRCLSALLTALPQEQEIFYAKRIPLGVFKAYSKEMYWIYSYREKYGVYPSRVAVQTNFGEPIPKHRDPLAPCLQAVLDLSMFHELSKVNRHVKDLLDAGTPLAKAMAVFKQGAAQLQDYSVDYVDSHFGQSKGTSARYKELVRLRSLPNNQLIDFPWPSLNKLVFCLRPGNTVTFAARLALGKTWYSIAWAYYLALKNIKVLFVTKEMPTEEIEDRFEALNFQLPYSAFRRGELPPKILRRWQDERNKPSKIPLIICGDETIEGTGLEHVTAKIEQYKPQVVIIDGAYLLQPTGLSRNASKVEKLAFLSSRAKVIAKTTKTVIMSVVQLNRSAEDKQGNTKGGIVSIYGADTWAQDSDYVLTLNGQRGATSRMISLDKGRESGIGEFNVGFKLDPYPNFQELNQTMKTGSQFQGIQ